jgi:hypothetical protein
LARTGAGSPRRITLSLYTRQKGKGEDYEDQNREGWDEGHQPEPDMLLSILVLERISGYKKV